jgi:acetylornithine/N-succinyldiaminopimelate aminotransferase
MTAVMPTYARADLVFERGEGAWLITESGERFLDFGAGVAVTALGHCHPHLVDALNQQAGTLWHVSNLYRISGQERLAERLAEVTFADVAFFGNSGAEAMECAIKMARKFHSENGAPERYRMITFEGAFHGRTLATIAAGGNAKHLEGFGPTVEGFDQVKLGDLDAVKKAIGPETAAIIIEPVQGEGGINPVASDFLTALRSLADENGILLILDEIQTGVGRTGKLFAHERAGITPDIMAVAKGIGGGFPVGACLATRDAAKGMTAGTHGSTFGGNLLAMAVANAVLDVVLEPGFLERVEQAGKLLREKLEIMVRENHGILEEVRGEGLMIGMKCRVSNMDLIEACYAEGLLTVVAGDNVVRMLPPLIISDEEIDEACERLRRACRKLAQSEKAEG